MTVIENYLQILKPLYLLNVELQSNEMTIGNLIPLLLKITYILERTQTTIDGQKLCKLLVSEIKRRFEYELGSSYYRVSI